MLLASVKKENTLLSLGLGMLVLKKKKKLKRWKLLFWVECLETIVLIKEKKKCSFLQSKVNQPGFLSEVQCNHD